MAAREFDARIWLMAIGTFAVGTDAFVVAGILPLLAAAFGVSVQAAGALVSVYGATYGIGTPLLAVAIARWPRHRVVPIALAGFAAINILCALAPSYGVLLALKIAAGLCAAIYTPCAYALAASLVRPEKRGAALAAVAIGLSAASVLGVPLGTWIGNRAGWHATFGMIAAVTLLGLGLMLWRGLPDSGDARNLLPSLAIRIAPLGRKRVWLALLPTVLLYVATALVFTYVALLLETRYSVETLPALLAVYGLGGLAGSQFGGRLADRIGAVKPIYLGLGGLVAVLLVLPASLGATAATCAALFAATFFSWGCFAPMQARLIELEPDDVNVVIALINTGVYLGNAIGALIGGLLLRFIPVIDLPFAAAAMVAVALLTLWRYGAVSNTVPTAPPPAKL
jgi:MFS transporter, DHA1 family, inner membrane transport protein